MTGQIPGTLWRAGIFVSLVRPLDAGKWHFWLWAAGVFVVLAAVAVYGVVLYWTAWYAVGGAPTAEMFICDKHGPMPVGAVFTLFEETLEYTTPEGTRGRGPIRVCPICYGNALKTARQGQLEKERVQEKWFRSNDQH